MTVEKEATPTCSGRSLPVYSLDLHDRVLVLRRPLLVGILNLTPDSFSDGGRLTDSEAVLQSARRMILDGADILDVGAESSRPGADPVPAEAELDRLRGVLPRLLQLGAPVSIDTYKPQVADYALERGAHLINDITGLSDAMLEVVVQHRAPAIVMHMGGSPKTMQQRVKEGPIAEHVFDFLAGRIGAARQRGVQTIADVGFGFGKTVEQNLELLASLSRFHKLEVPLLIGTSRKSTLGALTGQPVEQRTVGSLATAAEALQHHVHLIRMHDVAEHRELIQVSSALATAAASVPSGNTHISLAGIPVNLYLGVPDEERAAPQSVIIDLEFEVDYQGSRDHVDDTLDYTNLPTRVQELAAGEPVRLLETLAERVGEALLAETGALSLRVSIHKPAAAEAIGCNEVVLERLFRRASTVDRHDVFVALGSNLGNRRENLDAAVSELRRLGIVQVKSQWIESEPEDAGSGPDYLNGVVWLRTPLAPNALMQEFFSIERRFGRCRERDDPSTHDQEQPGKTVPRQQPSAKPSRTLDLDLLLYDDLITDCPTLTVPHPRMLQRSFVLEPLAEIAPDVLHPIELATAADLLRRLEA